MSDAADKAQPGLTDAARDQLDVVADQGGFADKLDAYRLALAIALAQGLEPAAADVSRKTYVNVGSLDPDGAIKSAVLAVRDDHDDRPVAFMERLAEAGIAKLYEHLESGKSLREILALYEPQTQ
jgi:hypothetical protein